MFNIIEGLIDQVKKISQVVRYSVGRLVKMVEEVSDSGNQLLEPDLLEEWLPSCSNNTHLFKNQLLHLSGSMRKAISKNVPNEGEQEKYIELLEFIQDELLHSNNPRKFLIECALSAMNDHLFWKEELQQLEQLVEDYFSQLVETEKTPNH